MIIDMNAYLGHWPFRQIRHNTAGGLLRLMDRHGIDVAVVSSLSSIFYKNAHAGNEEVAKQVKNHRDRLVPWGVINPTYADWERDLEVCVQEFGMSGLRLYPDYHNYTLEGEPCRALVNAATERKLVLSLPLRVTDSRQSHWLWRVPEVSPERAASLVRAFPNARFVLVNGVGYARSGLARRDSGLPSNYWIEISRSSAVMGGEIRQLVDALTASRVVFGTGMPMKDPMPALVKMDVLTATTRQKEQILSRNAKTLLGRALQRPT